MEDLGVVVGNHSALYGDRAEPNMDSGTANHCCSTFWYRYIHEATTASGEKQRQGETSTAATPTPETQSIFVTSAIRGSMLDVGGCYLFVSTLFSMLRGILVARGRRQ